MSFDPGRLRDVRGLDDVLALLGEELDWPIGEAGLEDATFDFTPFELGIPSDQVPRLRSLSQLRPLTATQPWGIFFLQFEGPRLPVGVLRRLLRAVVARQRKTGGVHRTWHLDDLLFITCSSDGDAVELHLVAFFDVGGASPEIRSLPWRPGQSPPQHLKRLATELLPRLAWPDDDDIEKWRVAWRDAFRLRHGDAIASAARLAERMAETAHSLRQGVATALTNEVGDGPFSELLEDVRRELVAEVDEARFADMCAQTLVYGTLTSRITDPDAFGALPTLATIPLSNPFLTAFFEQVHDQTAELDFGDSGLEALAADLRETNVEAVLDQFGSTAKGGDPVIHFYEEFLAKYDRQMRADAGAFYTPQPVVRFIVAAVDEVMRTTFRLKAGIADDATWSQVADRTGFDVPPDVEPESRFVSMLDPATGTGTFLVEWLRKARSSYLAAQRMPEWHDHLRETVLPGMHAFEVMLAPYAIAHLKVALELEGEEEQVGSTILLTDALDYPAAAERFEALEDPVAQEGQRAAALKRDARFSVVVGNPPYDREQRGEEGGAERRKGGVVRYGVSGIPPLLEAVLEPLRAAGLGVHAKNVYNDYVYFWRYATWQATQRRPGPGVVAFITAASYLEGKSLGGLRHHLRDVFDELWVIDLGGEGRGARVEENVFDIRTPVAIAIGVRHRGTTECEVRYLRVEGSREYKFGVLDTLTLDPARFERAPGDGLSRLRPTAGSDYSGWPEITEIFPWVHSGCQLKRTWPISHDPSLLERRWRTLVEAPTAERGALLRETGYRTVQKGVSPLLNPSAAKLAPLADLRPSAKSEGPERYGYRSFDRQWVLADNRLADRPRPDLWAVRSDRQVYLTTLTSTVFGNGPLVTATPYVPDLDHFRGSYGAKNVLPLWRDSRALVPNTPSGLLSALSQQLDTEVSPEELLAYVYSLLGTGAFAERFSVELGQGAGPARVPITAAAATFHEAVALGSRLLRLHTWGERFGDAPPDDEPQASSELAAVEGYPEDFDYNADIGELRVGTGRFGPVPREVWEFEVSGLRPLQSWLGYRMAKRKGKRSSPLDDMAPVTWSSSHELVELLNVLEQTVRLTPAAAELIDRVVSGPLIDAALLPTASEEDRKPPRS